MAHVSRRVVRVLGARVAWHMIALAGSALGLAFSAHAADTAPPIRVSGFVETAYAITTGPRGGRIVGNFYLPRRDAFLLSVVGLKVERALAPGARSTGFVVEALAGEHARVVRAAGLDLGEHADLIQAFGTLGFPSGLQVSAGKMATLLGNEVIESVLNPHLSVGNAFVFAENATDLGADVAWTGPRGWSLRARCVNGWDVVVDPNSSKTLFGKVAWSDGPGSAALLGYSGVELPDSVGGRRSGAELLASAPIGPIPVTLQLDAGREPALDARWWAAGIWAVVPLDSELDLALRADALDDRDGARTSGALGFPALDGQRLLSFTATLRIRTVPGALIRPEGRYERSDLPVYDGRKGQWTYALGVAWMW